MTSADILARVKISDVARAMGVEPHRGRIAPPWRETRDRNVSVSDEKNCWHDFVTDEAGGLLSFVVKARNCSKADALKFVAGVAGVPLGTTPFTAADRARWARERRAMERDLPAARYWRDGALAICDERLAVLKAALFAPDPDLIGWWTRLVALDEDDIAWWTAERARLDRLTGSALVTVYREAARRERAVTQALVKWARRREELELDALVEYLFGVEVAA